MWHLCQHLVTPLSLRLTMLPYLKYSRRCAFRMSRKPPPKNSLYTELSSSGEQSKHLWQDTEVQMTASVRETESRHGNEQERWRGHWHVKRDGLVH